MGNHVSQAKVRENVELVLRDQDGNIKQVEKASNLIVTTGVQGIVDRLLASPTVGVPTHAAIGTGTTAAAAGDTTLQTELDRNALTSKNRSGAVLTMVADWAAGDGTGTITEAGIFNASSSGTLFSRVVFAAVGKTSTDTLQVTWTWTLSAP